MTSDESIGFSADFPPGYGDFEIQSSDNTVFSFPRGVLSHASPVFKDMFTFGDANTGDNQKPLVVTEDSTTIRNLLLYLDPLKESVELTKDTVGPFLEVAMKYQIPEIPERIDRVELQHVYNSDDLTE